MVLLYLKKNNLKSTFPSPRAPRQMFKVQNLKNELELITLPQSFVVVFVVKNACCCLICPMAMAMPNYGTPFPLDTHPPEHSSPWNIHPPGTPTGIGCQGRSISYIYIRQGDELQHYSNETSSAFQQQKWTKVHKYKHQMD